MDSLDSKIIGILQDDGRASNAGIARAVGVSEGTIRRRLKRLVDEDFIKVVAHLDRRRMGYSSEAIVGIQVDPSIIDQVADAVSALNEVSWVVVTTGAYDIFAWVELQSSEELGVFLRRTLGAIPGVRRTETFVNLAIKKSLNGVTV